MGEPEVPPFPQPPSWRERVDLLVGARPAGARLVAGGAALVVALAVVVLLVVRDRPGPPPELRLPVAGGGTAPAAGGTTTTTAPTSVLAHAAGAVVAPGVYRLPAGSRVTDLVGAAGGPTPGADVDLLNLAAPLTDGERVYVPVEGEVVPGPAVVGPSGAGVPTGPLDLNAATAAQLDALPGVGPATAAAILEERGRRGRFEAVDELLDVPGIGDVKLERLRPLVRV